jgi:acetolactate synthase-1/2/3 large subunit
MNKPSNRRSGGRVLIDQLRIHGVDTVFCVPGESFLAALDAFHDTPEIRLVTCRHEAGAANMAEAYGKMTGRPGIVFVTRGPGACHAVVGLHTALQDSTPVILFVGQVGRDMTEREAFQEMDFRRFFSEVTKWSAQIDDAGRIPELVSHAFHTAMNGRPGPVALALPEDMLTDLTEAVDAARYRRAEAHPGPADMARLRELLATARAPLVMLGGGTWTPRAVADITEWAAASRLPVTTSFRCQDRFDNAHPCYAGEVGIGSNPKLLARIKAADLLIAVGPRLGEMTTQGYSLVGLPRPAQTLVHVHPGAEELGRVYQADLPINASMPAFAAAARGLEPIATPPWAAATEQAHAEYLANAEIVDTTGRLDMAQVCRVLRQALPKDAVICNDAGNHAGWAHRYLPFSVYPSQVGPTSGAMGYGVPAALGACLAAPDRLVISFVGDGGFLMSGQEIATAMQHGLRPILLVVNNNAYGTIRMHQDREFPGRYPGTDLQNPDFAAFAQSFGAFGEVVEESAQFAGAFERARGAGRCAVLELRTDLEAITTRTTLSAIREAALAKRR